MPPLPCLTLLGLALAAPLQHTDDGGAPQRTELAVDPTLVPLELGAGWPVVEVFFGDRGPYRMIVDTGAMGLVLYGELAQELGLERIGETRIGDPSDPTAVPVEVVRVPELRLGDAYFSGIEAISWRDSLRSGDVRGIVGLPVFAGCTLTLDFPGAELRLTRAPLAPGSRAAVQALERDPAGLISVPIEVAGHALHAHLDTGNAGSLILPGQLMPEIALVEGTRREALGRRASGEVRFVIGTLQGDVRFGTATVARPEVRLDPGLPVLNVGFGLLRDFALTIDQRSTTLALDHRSAASEPPAAPVTAPQVVPGHASKRRLGLEMLADGSAPMRVRGVQPGSLGERVGLRAGDVLRSVDGQPIDHHRPGALVRALDGDAAFELALEREGRTLVLRVPAATTPAPADPEARLERLLGLQRVEGWIASGASGAHESLAGEAHFERTHDGRFVRETFTLHHGERTFAGEAYFAWRPARARYELTQIDAANPATPWLTGVWLEDEQVLRFESVPEARPRPELAVRWEYRFPPEGGFVKQLLTSDGGGPFELRSEYRYRPRS